MMINFSSDAGSEFDHTSPYWPCHILHLVYCRVIARNEFAEMLLNGASVTVRRCKTWRRFIPFDCTQSVAERLVLLTSFFKESQKLDQHQTRTRRLVLAAVEITNLVIATESRKWTRKLLHQLLDQLSQTSWNLGTAKTSWSTQHDAGLPSMGWGEKRKAWQTI